jgi:REP-associated tyrosine transposase
MISGFNAAVTREYRALQGDAGMLVWQRNYHEHVIRNEEDLDNIRRYARNNPAQ